MAKYLLQITKALAQNDLVLEIEPSDDIEALDLVRDLKDSADDGWRMLPMRSGLVSDEADIASYVLREGAKAELHTYEQSSGSVMQYDSIADALIEINVLNASDGFMLIDELGDSRVIYHRPSLWISDESDAPHKRVNNHGRQDLDRI